MLGFNVASDVGRVDLVRRENSLSADDCNPGLGVFLNISKARYSSVLSSAHFVMRFLALRTALSANPFDCGYLGLDVICSKPHNFAKLLNTRDLN